jgi:GNAT superfamily N-acetyltransferase
MISLQTLISTAQGGPAGLLEDVTVTQAWRGRGVGRALLATAEAWARDNGLSRLQLLADRANEPALAFYRRAGWQETQLAGWRKILED